MRRPGRLMTYGLFITGLAMGVGIAYTGPAPLDSPAHSGTVDRCPAFVPYGHLFKAGTGENWIEAGQMANRGGSLPGGAWTAPLPRHNFIDDYLFDAMEKAGVPHAPLCEDHEFMRRVYLDLTGRIPSAPEVKAFLAGKDNDKRDRLVDDLLRTPEYADRMTMWLGDLLQIGFPPPGTLGLFHGRSTFQNYLRQAVADNRPYGEIVTELLTALGDNWDDGPVNFLARGFEAMANPYDVMDNLAAQMSSKFLGVPAICISCHGGANHLESINTYLAQRRRADLWGLAAFFSGLRSRIEIRSMQPRAASFIFNEVPSKGYDVTAPEARGGVRPERRPSPEAIVPPRYFFTGQELTDPDSATWRAQLAEILLRDPQFAKATANYLWKELFGMGIIDPPDTVDLARPDQATHPELLERLGREFVESGYDIKHMVALMVKSNAYQLSARFPGEWKLEYAPYFARRFAKRMPAEMVLDAVVKSSGVPNTYYVEVYPDDVREFHWAMQLPDTTEPRALQFNPLTEEQTAANTRSRTFLDYFFRGDRYNEPRKPVGSILQTLALTNSPIVLDRVSPGQGGRIDALVDDTKLTNAQIVDELFLATVSRYPTDQEKEGALPALEKDRREGAVTLYLALLNKLDFIFY